MDWQELTRLTQGQDVVVERVRLLRSGIAIEGEFELPQLAGLTVEEQVFVTAFVRCHGSIKEMERLFGISYPTVKARLNRIAEQLEFVQTDIARTEVGRDEVGPGDTVRTDAEAARAEIIDRLHDGEINALQAAEELEKLR